MADILGLSQLMADNILGLSQLMEMLVNHNVESLGLFFFGFRFNSGLIYFFLS
jgi:hypothetical protein